MGKIGNTLSILTLLSSGKKYNAKELADIIEVTPRQVRTYIEELEEAGIYVEVVKGRYGGYYYQSSKYDYQVQFDINEVNTLEKVFLLIKDSINDENLFDILSIIIEKMRYIVLYSSNKNNVVSDESSKKMYNILSSAIYSNFEVILKVKKNSRVRDRRFAPQSIYVNNNMYYVTGYCLDVQDIRTFPFSEIISINVLK